METTIPLSIRPSATSHESLHVTTQPRGWSLRQSVDVTLVSLTSAKYPSSGETHGLSVVAGALEPLRPMPVQGFRVLDLAAMQEDDVIGALNPIDSATALFVSTPYGTFPQIQQLLGHLARKGPSDRPALVVMGGATATYLWKQILDLPFDPKVIVIGEGDLAAPALIESLSGGRNIESIPNLAFTDHSGDRVTTRRELVKRDAVARPYRAHLSTLPEGTQIFLEASRGCSWASCSFCLRGLTDIDGKPREFRRLSGARIIDDLKALKSMSLTTLTFADEDVLGGNVDAIEDFARELELAITEVGGTWTFDASATIRSIHDQRDTATDRRRRLAALRRLKRIGFLKIFLGIESGSVAQTRRYNKGHTPTEALGAIDTLSKVGIKAEIGFIMFDPLTTLSEIAENCRFLLDNDLSEITSYPLNEMRLQPGSGYLAILHRIEAETDRRLYDRDVELTSLIHPYQYLHYEVAVLVRDVSSFTTRAEKTAYPLKVAARYGTGRRLGVHATGVREALATYRRGLVESLLEVSMNGGSYEESASTVLRRLQSTVMSFGITIDEAGHLSLS